MRAHGRCSGFYLRERGLCIGKNFPCVFLLFDSEYGIKVFPYSNNSHSEETFFKSSPGADISYHIHTNTQEHGMGEEF